MTFLQLLLFNCLLTINHYSCLLSNLAFEWQRGWSWPWFDTDLTAFVVLIKLFLY